MSSEHKRRLTVVGLLVPKNTSCCDCPINLRVSFAGLFFARASPHSHPDIAFALVVAIDGSSRQHCPQRLFKVSTLASTSHRSIASPHYSISPRKSRTSSSLTFTPGLVTQAYTVLPANSLVHRAARRLTHSAVVRRPGPSRASFALRA